MCIRDRRRRWPWRGSGAGQALQERVQRRADGLHHVAAFLHHHRGHAQAGDCLLYTSSYADIFFNNSFKNGLLPIVLSELEVARLFDEVKAFPAYKLNIDLDRQVVVAADGRAMKFDIEPFRKYCLLNGFDDIGLTLRHADKIRAFEAERLARHPWLESRPIA